MKSFCANPLAIGFKKALITGATSGLGLELCNLLRQRGAKLLVTGRTGLPEADIALRADLIHERRIVIDLIEKEVPDLVINCAGFGAYGPVLNHSLDLLEVNANAAIEITIAAAKAMMKNGVKGVILNVSSAAGLIPMPYMALYGAAKAALTSFSRSFDAEMAPFGIRVLVTLPGQIQTEFASRASGGKFTQRKGLKKEWVAQSILKQIDAKRPFKILDWRVQLGIFFAKLFPNWTNKLIMNELSKRVYSL